MVVKVCKTECVHYACAQIRHLDLIEGNISQDISMWSGNEKQIFCIQDGRSRPQASLNFRHFHMKATLDNIANSD